MRPCARTRDDAASRDGAGSESRRRGQPEDDPAHQRAQQAELDWVVAQRGPHCAEAGGDELAEYADHWAVNAAKPLMMP